MAFGITDDGFVLKRFEDIRDEVYTALRTAFGDNIDLDDQQPLGLITNIFVEQIADSWESAQAVYNSFWASTATGVSLDRIAALNGVTRLQATYSTGELQITGTNGTFIDIGDLRVGNGVGGTVVNSQAGTISGGTLTLACRAESTGDTTYLAGTLTTILTPIFGVSAVTNPADVSGGRNTETDAEFRLRRAEFLQASGSSNVEGIRNALLDLEYVTAAIVVEDVVNHTISCSILTDLGGAISGFPDEELEVAETIFNAKAAGIETLGSNTVVVTDSQGITHDVKFSEATEVACTISFTVTENTDAFEGDTFPTDGEDQIKAAIVAYFADLSIGQDVWINKIEQAASSIAGVKGVASTLLNGAGTNLSIATTELATISTSNISITVV